MNKLRLNASCFFGIEPYGPGLRLTVFNGDTEWVCHKVKGKDFKNFLQAEVAHLFKGRLQLIKNQDNISVQVMGMIIGIIGRETLRSILQSIKKPVSS